MNFRKMIINYLMKQAPKPAKRLKTKSFKAAFQSRFINWLFTTGNSVNIDLLSQLKTLIQRSRSLAQNNQLFRAYLNNCQKSIVGAQGFTLQMQITNSDGTLNDALNLEIERAWEQFTKKGNIQLSEQYGDVSLDAQILRTILTDGECFIQIIRDASTPFGIRFKLIDTLSVDCNYIQIMTETQNGIFNGVEVDHNYKPVRYWLREGYNGNYESGRLYAIPAEDIIHLYRPEFINQVRGFSPVVASFESLKQLDDFGNAELIAAKIQSCQGIFYQRNDKAPVGDFMSQSQMDDEGTFISQLSPGMASVVPNGYNVKTLTPNHPNSQYGQFVKAIGKRVASSMGTNYNTLFGDLQSVNYSSLRQANIAENAFYKSWQQFMIDNWKNIQFELFLKGYLINSKTELKPSLFKSYLTSYRFIGKTDPSYDISKEILAIERSLKLGLTSHIQQIERRGGDPEEIIKDEVKWRKLCQMNNLPPNFYETTNQAPLDAVNQFNDESNNGDSK